MKTKTWIKLRKCSCFILAILLSCVFNLPAYAIENHIFSTADLVQRIDLEHYKSDILEVTETTINACHKVSIDNIGVFRNAIKEDYPSLNNYELGKLVLLATGRNNEYVDTLPYDKVVEAIHYESIEQTESYFRVYNDGMYMQITKEQYDEDIQIRTMSDIPEFEEDFGDLMLYSTAYSRGTSTSRCYYTVVGEVHWTGLPNFQMTDMLAIATTGNIDNNYDHYADASWSNGLGVIKDEAHLYDDDGGDGTFLKISTSSVNGLGVDIPIGVAQQNQVLIDYARLYYGVTAQSDISCQVSYAHAILAWTPSFSVNSKGALTFGGLGLQRQVFNGTAFTLYCD